MLLLLLLGKLTGRLCAVSHHSWGFHLCGGRLLWLLCSTVLQLPAAAGKVAEVAQVFKSGEVLTKDVGEVLHRDYNWVVQSILLADWNHCFWLTISTRLEDFRRII